MSALEDYTALVVGASRGVGRAIALELAEQGANLGLMARSKLPLEETSELCHAKGGQAFPMAVDVTDEMALEEAFKNFINHYKNLDILILCQGILYRNCLVDDKNDQWKKVMETNLLSCMHLTRLCLPHLLQKDHSARQRAIIYISSIAGKQASPGISAYCASKFGLVGFAHSMFEELREYGIKVSVVCPGYINTDMVSDQTHLNQDKMIQPKEFAQLISQIIFSPSSFCPVELIVRPQLSPIK